MSEKTIFKRIVDQEIPADIVYEDDQCLAFNDIDPQAPTHVLIIPKKEIASLEDASDEDAAVLGHCLIVARNIARDLGVQDGYRLVSNCGSKAGQSVFHIHFHLLAGRGMSWPPG